MTAALLIVASFLANQPANFAVSVDFVVINRVRSYSVEHDGWGRPRYSASEQWWVSFWVCWRLPCSVGVIPAGTPTPILVDRGWWTMSQVRTVAPSSSGWLIDDGAGLSVHAGALVVIDSDYDWEMKNRRIYRPMRKP